MLRAVEIESSFWSKVDYDVRDVGRCWPWLGGVQRGYGAFYFRDVSGKKFAARPHRLAYELTFGELPTRADSGIEIDHLCHDPEICKRGDHCMHRRCCNPYHLRLSNSAANGAPDRMVYWQTLKTHCPQGHEYSSTNTGIRPNGHRYCRACSRNRMRARNANRREAQ